MTCLGERRELLFGLRLSWDFGVPLRIYVTTKPPSAILCSLIKL